MASILMKRLPQVFGVHFHREGVLHQIRQLADPEVPLGVSPPKCPSSTGNFLYIKMFYYCTIKYIIYYLYFSFLSFLGSSLPSPQPGPSNTSLCSTTMFSSSNATSPIASPSTNGNILFGTIATCQLKSNLSASMETHTRNELNSTVDDVTTPQSAHLYVCNTKIS